MHRACVCHTAGPNATHSIRYSRGYEPRTLLMDAKAGCFGGWPSTYALGVKTHLAGGGGSFPRFLSFSLKSVYCQENRKCVWSAKHLPKPLRSKSADKIRSHSTPSTWILAERVWLDFSHFTKHTLISINGHCPAFMSWSLCYQRRWGMRHEGSK